MNGGAGGLDGDLAVTQEQDLLSPHPDVETFSSFSLHGNKQSLTLVTQRRLHSKMACLLAAVFGGLKLCGLVLVPGNAWT